MRNATASEARRRLTALIFATALAFGSVACVGPHGPGPKTQFGAVTGAAAGGLLSAALGAESEGIVAGVLIGGLVGGAFGNALDNADRRYAQRTAYYGLEHSRSGHTSRWYNPDSGHSGSFTPQETYETRRGRYCREYSQTIRIGGRSERAYGTACRQRDGSWKIVS